MSMDNLKWQDKTVWSSDGTFDLNSYKNVLLINCPVCPFFTFKYNRLLEHLLVSAHPGPLESVFYSCNECKMISTSYLLLKEHFSFEHSSMQRKHSSPISCLQIRRFMETDEKRSESQSEAQCLLCSYQGSDLPHHYSKKHNVATKCNLLKPSPTGPLNVLNPDQYQLGNGEMQMSDGTLIVIPEEPKEPDTPDSSDSQNRKLCPPLSPDYNNGDHMDESEESETNSESFDNQFVCNNSNIEDNVLLDSPQNNFEPIPLSFIDSHMNNVMVSDDESSEHSSDFSRPMIRDMSSLSYNYVMSNGNDRNMSIFGKRMLRKRGRPPKISSQIFSKEEIENELAPHVENVGKTDGKDAVRIAAGEPYSVVVPLSLLVSAFDTDGVQYLKNLIRFYYQPEQLALFAWDVTQKRGRPRTSITVCADPSTNDVANIKLQSLRQQSFVQASMRLIERLFDQAFPANLPIFINRLLQSHRFYVYGTTGTCRGSSTPSTNPLVFNDDAHKCPVDALPSMLVSPYREAETRLSRFWTPCLGSDKDVRLTAACPPIRKHLVVCAYDLDPVRFFRNLVRSALPLEELLRATWKGRNTGRPRFEPNDDGPDDKRPLIDHPLVRAFLEFVPQVCGQLLPDNLGPVIHQLLATVRKTQAHTRTADP